MTSTADRTDVGRPRDPRIDAAVLAATVDLLATDGYAGVSVDAIASAAGTTKAAIYRRWPSKAHLVHEAAFPDAGPFDLPTTGSLLEDMHIMLTGALMTLSTPVARAALPGLVLEFGSDRTLHKRLLDRLRTTVWDAMNQRIADAVAGGEVRPDVDAAVLIEAIAGTTFFALLTHADDMDDAWVEKAANLLTKGIQP